MCSRAEEGATIRGVFIYLLNRLFFFFSFIQAQMQSYRIILNIFDESLNIFLRDLFSNKVLGICLFSLFRDILTH